MNRWGEEKGLTLSEMIWVPLYFINQADRWQARSLRDPDGNSGKAYYARKMESLWRQLHVDAIARFQKVQSTLQEPIQPTANANTDR